MKSFKKIVNIIVLVILLPILFVNVVILINSFLNPDEIPSFFGWKPFIVLSGSMESEISTGDLVIVKECNIDDVVENDIIAFKEGEIVITHRVVDIIEENGEKRYITKGDNNKTNDSGYVLEEQIEGIYKLKINGLGNLAMFVQTPIGMGVCLSIPLLILLLIQMKESQDKQKEIEILKKQNKELKNS